ncbi:NHL repeat-containing protein 2 [Hordeum vulgare]|nr:NHL repeat-containing protein 2 [Hordeum vulgare]
MGPNTLQIVLVGIADKKDDASSSTNEMYLDCEAFLAIHRTISPEVFKSISTCKSAHEVWTKLEDIYGGSNLNEDGIMMKELVHELFTLFDLKESTTTSISDCLHTSSSSISQGEANFLGGVARVKGVKDFGTESAKKRFFEIYLEKYAKPNSGIGYPGALELIMEVFAS